MLLAVTPLTVGASNYDIEILSVEPNFGLNSVEVRYTDLLTSAFLVVAAFDGDDRMVGAGALSITASGWGVRTVNVSVDLSDSVRIEVMVWDNANTMRPLHTNILPILPPPPPGSIIIEVGNSVMIGRDGNPIYLDVPPVVVNERILVPVRAFAEGVLDADVSWYDETQTIRFYKDGVDVFVRIGHNEIMVNGSIWTIDVPPMIIDDRTMVPVRAIGEAFGFQIEQFRDEYNNLTTYVIRMYYW